MRFKLYQARAKITYWQDKFQSYLSAIQTGISRVVCRQRGGMFQSYLSAIQTDVIPLFTYEVDEFQSYLSAIQT